MMANPANTSSRVAPSQPFSQQVWVQIPNTSSRFAPSRNRFGYRFGLVWVSPVLHRLRTLLVGGLLPSTPFPRSTVGRSTPESSSQLGRSRKSATCGYSMEQPRRSLSCVQSCVMSGKLENQRLFSSLSIATTPVSERFQPIVIS